jgi:hypothetical protein
VELSRAKQALHLQLEGAPAIKNLVICLMKRCAFLVGILKNITKENDVFRKFWPSEQKEAIDIFTKTHAIVQQEPAYKDIIHLDLLADWAELAMPAMKGGVPDTQAVKEQKQIAKIEEKVRKQLIKAEHKATKTPSNKTQKNNKRNNVEAFGNDVPLDAKEETPPNLEKHIDNKQEIPTVNVKIKQEHNNYNDNKPINPPYKRKRTKLITYVLQPPKDTEDIKK